MAVTKSWKVYGREGHRQRMSFEPSQVYDFTNSPYSLDRKGIRIIEFENSDKTGTNEYSVVRITRNTAEECEQELAAQLSDGFFENCHYGDVVEI